MATARKSESPSVIAGVQTSGLPVVLTIAALFVALAALVPLIQSSGATSTAGNVRLLEEQRDGWEAQMQQSQLEAAQLGSLDRIEQEARTRLGMVAPTETHFIRVNAPAPQPVHIPSRYLPPQERPGSGGSSLWEELFGWVPLP